MDEKVAILEDRKAELTRQKNELEAKLEEVRARINRSSEDTPQKGDGR